jgi:hypothetical protein
MSARTELAQLLADTLPLFDVVPVYKVPDNLDSVASGGKVAQLILWRDTLTPGPTLRTRSHAFVVWLIVPGTDPETVDDELDEQLGVFLNMLDDGPLPRVGWTTAERGVLAESYPGYRVTLAFHTDKQGS